MVNATATDFRAHLLPAPADTGCRRVWRRCEWWKSKQARQHFVGEALKAIECVDADLEAVNPQLLVSADLIEGLLQALQVAFDGAESVAKVLGVRLRSDCKGGKAVIVTRNIVAGHPIGGNMNGKSWHHCHDRATAHDKAIIRVMSFSRSDPGRWTGQTLRTEELIKDGLHTIKRILRDALNSFATTPET